MDVLFAQSQPEADDLALKLRDHAGTLVGSFGDDRSPGEARLVYRIQVVLLAACRLEPVCPELQDRRCLIVPAGHGVKTQWLMPVPKDRSVRVKLWYRVPAGAALTIKAALFKSERWLQRYADIAAVSSTGAQWTRLEQRVVISDPEATQFDIEFTAKSGDCRVDDIDVRAGAPAPKK
jgi:hypothetical protein